MAGFVPPPYPYDRLDAVRPLAEAVGPVLDFSIGTPFDPPPRSVLDALVDPVAARRYPPSVGGVPFREAAAAWIDVRFGVHVDPGDVAACIGSKEFVATLPQWLQLRSPDLDTVLYPAVSYPTYEMGATLAGCRAVPVEMGPDGHMRLDSIEPDDAERALVLWVNSPANPTGGLDDLDAAAAWGRAHGVPVVSDECYAEFTWNDRPRTILETGLDGVIALHSLSKRSNLAGVRAACYVGDPELVHYLRETRKHVGMMVPGPAQNAAVVAFGDAAHVDEQRERYRRRLDAMAEVVGRWAGVDVEMPGGGFYLWIEVGDAWAFTKRLAREGGAIVSPGEFYGPDGASHVRVAVVQPDDAIVELARRLGVAG